MPRVAKYLLIAFSIVLCLLLVLAGIVAAAFNPNDYKPLVIRLVQEKKQRTLSIPGDIKLTFFPKIGADLGRLSISEHKSANEFASVDSARVSLALIPLLSKKLVVDRIMIDGISANITRNKDGSTNFDDLLSKEESDRQISFDIDRVSITNARLQFDDRLQERKVQIAYLNVKTGKLANTVPGSIELTGDIKVNQPSLDVKLKVSAAFTLDADKQSFDLPQLRVTLDGKQDANPVSASLAASLTADMRAKRVEITKLGLGFTVPNPAGGDIKLALDGNATLDPGKQNMAGRLKGKLDESTLDFKFGLARFAPAAYTFEVGIDRLDLDRYRSKPAAKPEVASATAADTPIELAALKTLNASGAVRIGALKANNIKLSNLKIDLRAADGKLDLTQLAADLYGGRTSGGASVSATGVPRFSLRQNLVGISVGALLKDAAGKDALDGKGNVLLDLATQGVTVSQIRKSLNGAVRLDLRNGAVRGVNVVQMMRNAKTKLGALQGGAAPQTGVGSSSDTTEFSELTASFRIAKGIAHNDDLSVKSPLILLAGSGDINVGEGRLDYLVKASVAPALQEQGGAGLQALKGVTIPVRLSGPFGAIAWQLDVASMAGEFAKQKAGTMLQDQFKDKLKGLFGK